MVHHLDLLHQVRASSVNGSVNGLPANEAHLAARHIRVNGIKALGADCSIRSVQKDLQGACHKAVNVDTADKSQITLICSQ